MKLKQHSFDEIEIIDPGPRKGSFGVHLDGDSMEQKFKAEQLVHKASFNGPRKTCQDIQSLRCP